MVTLPSESVSLSDLGFGLGLGARRGVSTVASPSVDLPTSE